MTVLCSQVRAGIAEMHEKGFAHRDVKHRNVLFFPEVQGEVNPAPCTLNPSP